jgi:ribose transport system ATP-binding protein
MDLDLSSGEIHGLVGQNGSGKSTFIKILSGFHSPDPGARLWVRGQAVSLPLTESDPKSLGISFVHQDLGLFDRGTVLENMLVGRYQTGAGWRISWRRERQRTRESLRKFGLDLDPETPVSELTDVQRAMVAIARALDRSDGVESGVLVLDEPTSYLPRDSVDEFFRTVRQAAAMGFAVLFVTHRIEEVIALTERVTVLRDGEVVERAATASLTQRDLVATILGFSLDQLYPSPHVPKDDEILRAQNVSAPQIANFDLTLSRGEIVGLTGLLGMGQERIPYLLFGAERATGGTLKLADRTQDIASMTPGKAVEMGLALLPANRLRDGGMLSATALENMTLPTLPEYFAGGLLRHRRERKAVLNAMTEFDVRPPRPGHEFSTFSGGNQQKLLLAKWFATRPRVLLLHEPTIGVDVGAKRQIFKLIRDAAETGVGVIIAGVEYEDLAHLCDRVFVFRFGRVVSTLHGSDLTLSRIIERCFTDVSAESQPALGGVQQP